MRPKVSFVILKGARRNIPHDEPLGQSETKTITLRIHSIQVIPSGLLMSYRISLSEGVASVVSSRQRSGYYSFTTDLTDRTDKCPGSIKQIKKFVAFPRLTPLQPDAYAQPCKRASLSDHPHPSGLPCRQTKKHQNKIAALGSTK